MNAPQTEICVRRIHCAALSFLMAIGGCQGALRQPPAADPETHSDRLMRFYPELRSGRFAVIADLEEPAQLELFHLQRQASAATSRPELQPGNADTGTTCLAIELQDADDVLIVSGDRSANWFLKRDWRPYELLLVSLERPLAERRDSPAPAEALIEVVLGPRDSTTAPLQFREQLVPGWNRLRLDLAEWHGRVPLDDVREIRIRASSLGRSLPVRLDDLILTSNREDVFGDSANSQGTLFVQRAGLGWNVGAGGRFELGFAGGQIVRWHDLSTDPMRLRNLLPAPLMPYDLTGGERTKGMSFHAEFTERSLVRIVLEVEHRPSPPLGAGDPKGSHRCTYTIYPTGQVFVARQASLPGPFSAGAPDVRVTGHWHRDEILALRDLPATSAGPFMRPSAYLMSAPGGGRNQLLVVGESLVLSSPAGTADDHAAVVGHYPPCGDLPCEWHGQLYFRGSDVLTEQEALARALAYADPQPPDMELGEFENFSPASGCFKLKAAETGARMRLAATDSPYYLPAFQVSLPKEATDTWVYLNHRLIRSVAHSPTGDLVFPVQPGQGPGLVEVLFRR